MKYHVRIEFRYASGKSKTVTIGVYASFEEACKQGNKALEALEARFPLHKFPDGSLAKADRFSKNGGPWGRPNTLITDMAYLKTPFQFFAKIETLHYDDVHETVNDILKED